MGHSMKKNKKKYCDPKKNIQEPGEEIAIEINPAEHESGVRKKIGGDSEFLFFLMKAILGKI